MSYSISMHIGPLEFQPRLGLTLAALLVAGVCSGLGIWQLSRADEKSALADLLATRVAAKPQSLEAVDFSHTASVRFTAVEVTGRFDYEQQFHVPNRAHLGRPGVHVITPFHVEATETPLLINRGWISNENFRAAERYPESGPETTTLSGLLVSPARPPIQLGPANSDPSPWHNAWLFADPELYASKSGNEVYPLILLMGEEQPGRLQRSWKLPQPDPSMHYGYAIQWFAFALIALVIWGVLSNKRSSTSHVE